MLVERLEAAQAARALMETPQRPDKAAAGADHLPLALAETVELVDFRVVAAEAEAAEIHQAEPAETAAVVAL